MGNQKSKQLCRRATFRGPHPTQPHDQIHFGAALQCEGKGKKSRFLFTEVKPGGILHGAGIQENDELVSVNEHAVDKNSGVDSVLADVRKMGTIMLELKREIPKEKKPVYFIIVFNLSCSMEEGAPSIHQYGFFWRTSVSEWAQVAPPVMRELSRTESILPRQGDYSIQPGQTSIQVPEEQLRAKGTRSQYRQVDCREVIILCSDDVSSDQLVGIGGSLTFKNSREHYGTSGKFIEYAYVTNYGPNSDDLETLVVYVSCQDTSKCIAFTQERDELSLIGGFSLDRDPDRRALFNKQTTSTGDSYHFSCRGTASAFWQRLRNKICVSEMPSVFYLNTTSSNGVQLQ